MFAVFASALRDGGGGSTPHRGGGGRHGEGTIEEALAEVLRDLLKGGCNTPWPATVVELCSEDLDGYERKTAALSKDRASEIFRERLVKRHDLFAPGMPVLITQ